jgi:DNA replication and repair protein RecF
MAIHALRITDFRNLSSVMLEPLTTGLNLIYGENGSGKTSLLEAIYYLSTARSFRTASNAHLIRENTDKFSLYSQVLMPNASHIGLGAERDVMGTTRYRLGEKDASSVAALSSLLPTLVMNSLSHQLFEAGPAYRRKYLDWGLFYDNPGFLNIWRQYERALKQRNALLRERRLKPGLDGWTQALASLGEQLDAHRREYVSRVTSVLLPLVNELIPLEGLEVVYLPGWEGEQGFAEALSLAYADEMRAGHTLYGPHRADLDLRIGGVSVKHILSRGQQKCLICAMILAQGQLLAEQQNKGPIYLVDDLPSELDERNKAKIVALLFKQKSQLFITAIEQQAVGSWMANEPANAMKVFHVEHGCVAERAP